ncbi:MAG: hypothetical protein EB101_07335, partial [Chitinophagia bacterium]|nr:hypothetical protein [Chitinophagia bacterium]
MSATIILADHTGRLGNRMVLYSHVIAAAEEYGCKVINLSILAASHFFQGLHQNPLGSYPAQKLPFDLRWLTRGLRQPIQSWVRSLRGRQFTAPRWLAVIDRESHPVYRLDSTEFASLVRRKKLIFLWGYPFRCPQLVRKHQKKIRDFFCFRAAEATQASAKLKNCKALGKRGVCVHVRQDDAIYHPDLYIRPSLYAAALEAFLRSHASESWEAFVCSDGKVPAGLFPHESTWGVPRPLVEDLA